MSKPHYKLKRAIDVRHGDYIWDKWDETELLVNSAFRFKTDPKTIEFRFSCGDLLRVPLKSYIPVRAN